MSKSFWKAALIRAIRTWAQAAVGAIGGAVLVESVNWLAVLSAATLAAVLSLLTSVATGLPEVEPVNSVQPDEPVEPVVEYRYLDQNGIPIDGHFVLVHNVEEDVAEDMTDEIACGSACDLSQYLDEVEPKGGEGDETP